MKLVLVEWSDSNGVYGWHHIGEDDHLSCCISAGIMVRETPLEITITSDKSPYSVGSTTSIPKCAIKRIRTLKIRE